LFQPLFWLFVGIPFRIGRAIFRAALDQVRIPVGGEQSNDYAPVSPTSRQGQRDRRVYESVLNTWENLLADEEELAKNTLIMRASIGNPDISPENWEDAKRMVEESQRVIAEKVEQLNKDKGVYQTLDRLERRNTGMRELKQRRHQLETRQRAVEEAVLH